ncbi:hypothetical protein BJV82DRAFT_614808 [Fennellomyces sp. T-0311]|nr:hypothetical protein BJV82DRAFT_614808 [Fennellomyces sp. T-0311]
MSIFPIFKASHAVISTAVATRLRRSSNRVHVWSKLPLWIPATISIQPYSVRWKLSNVSDI